MINSFYEYSYRLVVLNTINAVQSLRFFFINFSYYWNDFYQSFSSECMNAINY